MELQTFIIDNDYSYSIIATDPLKNNELHILLKWRGQQQCLSVDATYALLLAYPAFHKNLHRIGYQGELYYRVFVDNGVCTTIHVQKTHNKEKETYERIWHLGFTPVDGGETVYFGFAWEMLSRFATETVRFLYAVKHWTRQINAMHQECRDECSALYMTKENEAPATLHACYQAMRKRWVPVCNCCEVKGSPKSKLPSYIGEKVASWKGEPYTVNEAERKLEQSVTLGVQHYGKESYF
jgi:hypothetical protein